MKSRRKDVRFLSEGALIRGWLYGADHSEGSRPAIVMAHGFGAVKEMHLDAFAEVFADAGFAVLVFDYRRLGESDGTPRQEIDPATQIEDYRNAITWIAAQDGIDPARVGIWGTSYSGGHVLVVAATDPRVACVVSQVPTISGHAVTQRRFTADALAGVVEDNAADRLGRMSGAAPVTRTLVSHDPDDQPVYAASEAVEWYTSAAKRGGKWVNRVTLRSLEYARAYEPGAWVPFIAPCPLLMIVAGSDVVTPTDLALEAYARAGEPKSLTMVRGGHFAAYTEEFAAASGAARDWFVTHLKPETGSS